MQYADGQEVLVGDKVRLGADKTGIVVCSIDRDHYTDAHPREQWNYLKKGVMIEFQTIGLVHYQEPEEDLMLLERAKS